METKINIAGILKNKPQGTKLYNLLYNINVELDTIVTTGTKTIVWCTDKFGNTDVCHRFYSEFGTIEGYPDGLQILLPSKEMRDWNKFAWKKGDVLTNSSGFQIFFDKWVNEDYTEFLGKIELLGDSHCYDTAYYTLASEEEALEFIKSVEEINNGKLNLETLEIEKSQPDFKDGDIVVTDTIPSMCYSKCIFILKGDLYTKDSKAHSYVFYNISNNHISYDVLDTIERDRNIHLATAEERLKLFDALTKEGKYWDAEKKEVVDLKPKIELKPFDKVLVRDGKNEIWEPAFFFRNLPEHNVYKYQTVGGKLRVYCIPFNEETAKLIGTSNDWKG